MHASSKPSNGNCGIQVLECQTSVPPSVSFGVTVCVHPYRHIHRLHQLFTELLHLKCIHIQRVMVLYYKHHMVKKGNMTPAVEKETETFLESVLALRIKCSEVLRSSKLSI